MRKFVSSVVAVLTLGMLAGVAPSAGAATISLEFLGSFDSGAGEAGSEIVAFDPRTDRMFINNGADNRIDVVDISDPSAPTADGSIDLSPYGAGVQSVAIGGRLGAAVVASDPVTEKGKAVFFDPATLQVKRALEVGALPDMVTFTHDNRMALVANEGEPRCIDANGNPVTDPALASNPEGSVSIIDLRHGIHHASVRTARFNWWNGKEGWLRSKGVIVGNWPGATVAQDIEPEYITVAPHGGTAYVTLQENNALATIDLWHAKVTSVRSFGLNRVSNPGNEMDASDEDDAFNQQPWPVKGMPMPDAIDSWSRGGKTFLITANEGDAREYFANAENSDENPDGSDADVCFLNEARVSDMALDAGIFPDAEMLQEDDMLGRLAVTTQFPSGYQGGTPPLDGSDPKDVEGLEYTRLASYGSRSFSVWSPSGARLFDSANVIESTVYATDPGGWLGPDVPPWATDVYDSRSDAKGPEPEAVAIAELGHRVIALVGLERAGGIMAFDATNPWNPSFIEWETTAGQVSPEGLSVIPADQSPTGSVLVLAAFEISGTTAIYELAT